MEQILFETISAAFNEAEQYCSRYAENTQELIQAARSETVRLEYGRGGSVLRRGYYCPALVKDIIIGNCSRGKLIHSFRKPPDYLYHFDAAGKLRLAENNFSTELILWEGNRELGFVVERKDGLCGLSVCDYSAGAPQNCRIFYHTVSLNVWEMYMESYRFREGFLDTAEVMNVLYYPSEKLRATFTGNAKNRLHCVGFTEEEIQEFVSGAYQMGIHELIQFKNNGHRLVSYSEKNLLPAPAKYPTIPERSYEISKQELHPYLNIEHNKTHSVRP